MQTRLDGKLALLYTLLILQVLIVMIYVATIPPPEIIMSTTSDSVSFMTVDLAQTPKKKQFNHKNLSRYWTIDRKIKLKTVETSKLFKQYNRTFCWIHGVKDNKIEDNENIEKCDCKQGWHGTDCGQPEVLWRAIMASKQNIKLKRRERARRIIYKFSIREHNLAIAEVLVEELYNVVDLFVICDHNNADDNFQHKLSKGLLKREQDKILYINVAKKSRKPERLLSKYVWEKIKSVVLNLNDDDIYVTTNPEQILNYRALMFLKVYDDWPQPIGFRLRWSVYGFFWQHPLKTIITLGACTVGLTHEAYKTNSMILQQELAGETNERDTLGLVIGDLNHYGGWYCYLCEAPGNIIINLRSKIELKEIHLEKNLDVPLVEDLIGTGLWLDGKTSLLRVSKSQDQYFAPEIVVNNTWKYDWLIENFYAKLDYY